MCLGRKFAVTNESQAHANSPIAHKAISSTGDTLTRPWTLPFQPAMSINPDDAPQVLTVSSRFTVSAFRSV